MRTTIINCSYCKLELVNTTTGKHYVLPDIPDIFGNYVCGNCLQTAECYLKEFVALPFEERVKINDRFFNKRNSV